MRAGIGLALISHVACSMIFVDAPPPQAARMRYFDCTDSLAAPIIDTTYLAFSLADTIAATKQDGQFQTSSFLAGLALAGLFGYSAYRGYTQTSECRSAQSVLRMRLEAPEGAVPRRVRSHYRMRNWARLLGWHLCCAEY